jgi:dual specificity tyrosine-phosphorylation-regulated kinase 2/3/4
MQVPRGLINTAFSLSSVASRVENPPPKPALPTTPQNILRFYIKELTDYEKGEVLDYEQVYFLGKSREAKNDPAVATRDGGEENQVFNHGYDDDKGDYKVVVGDHVGYRYEIVDFLGKGSFGTALACVDHKTKATVAVKIVKNKKKYYYQASVELKIL